jgi:hypothetical protein
MQHGSDGLDKTGAQELKLNAWMRIRAAPCSRSLRVLGSTHATAPEQQQNHVYATLNALFGAAEQPEQEKIGPIESRVGVTDAAAY